MQDLSFYTKNNKFRRAAKSFLPGRFRIVLVFLFALILSAIAGFFLSHYGIASAFIVLIAVIIIPVVYAIVVYPQFGIIVMLLGAYLLMWIWRLSNIDFPFGTLMDGLEGLLILGFYIKQKKERNWKIFHNSVSFMILVWIGYNLLEFFNPWAQSTLAWVYTVRSVALQMLLYFIFLFQIRTVQFIRFIFKLWIGLSFFAAVYAFKQEHFGFFPFEQRWLTEDPLREALFFIGGSWRKFSIFSDPVAFSYNMVVSSVLCVGLMTGPVARWKKIVLGLFAAFFLLNMLYSGTRGAYVLFPATMLLFCILKFNKKILFFSIVAAALVGFIIVMPTSNPTIYRFQTAFRPSDDPSFNVRANNQKRIQPYIQSHPMGGGLGATGVWGQRFAPKSYLANFPPDSGYVRVAVELGWVGLLLFCTLMFAILRTGINNFYRIRDPELKSYCLAVTLIVFTLNIGNYPQEALVQFPSNIYFYLTVALINVTYLLDKSSQEDAKKI